MTSDSPNDAAARVEQALQEFEAQRAAGSRPDRRQFADRYGGIEEAVFRELVWVEYLCRWKYDRSREHVVEYLEHIPPTLRDDHRLILKLIDIEFQFGGCSDAGRLKQRFPELAKDVEEKAAGCAAADADLTADEDPPGDASGDTIRQGVAPPRTPRPQGPELLEPDSILCVEDRYRIMSLMADGGQKYVYQAQQITPGRLVALKTPRHDAAGTSMLAEGQVIAQLDHQKIPPVMNLATSAERGAQVILAEKLIPGMSWETLLHGNRRPRGTVDG